MHILSLALVLRPLRQADPERPLPRWWGRAAHHLLIETLNLNDDASELRPFTTSTLYGYFPEHTLDLEGNYLMRFTGLNEQVSVPLLQAVQTGGRLAPGATVNLDYLDFQVLAVHQENGSHPLAAQTTYQELATASLLSSEPAPYRVSFTFASPTTFHRDGRQVAYPLPELVIGSLLDKWNTFAPIALPNEARRYAAECLALSRFELKSRRVKVAGGSQSGMVGRALFTTLTYDRYWMSLMQTLAHYSYYSGVGAKTSMGMGQCRRSIEKNEKASKPSTVLS